MLRFILIVLVIYLIYKILKNLKFIVTKRSTSQQKDKFEDIEETDYEDVTDKEE